MLGSPSQSRCCLTTAGLHYWVYKPQKTILQQAGHYTKTPDKNKKKSKTPLLCFASWNVRTIQPGLMSDLSNLDDVRKTALIDKELMRLKVDINALQEMKLADCGFMKEQHYTFFWQGKPEQETREYGIGFAVRNHLLQMITPPTEETKRMLTLCISTEQGNTNILCVYGPTMSASPETKDKFYDDLYTAVKNIPSNEFLLLLRDFIARVGSDRDIWPTCLGHHGIGKMNENGQWLLEFCCIHTFSVTNSFFQTKPHQKSITETPKIWLLAPTGSYNH